MKPGIKKGLTHFLTSTDSSLSTKNILGLSLLAGAVGFVFVDKDNTGSTFIDHIFPNAEGHTSGISNAGGQGVHSSHASHTNAVIVDDADGGDGGGDGGSGDGD